MSENGLSDIERRRLINSSGIPLCAKEQRNINETPFGHPFMC